VSFIDFEVRAIDEPSDGGNGQVILGLVEIDTLECIFNVQLSFFSVFVDSVEVEEAVSGIGWRLYFGDE